MANSNPRSVWSGSDAAVREPVSHSPRSKVPPAIWILVFFIFEIHYVRDSLLVKRHHYPTEAKEKGVHIRESNLGSHNPLRNAFSLRPARPLYSTLGVRREWKQAHLVILILWDARVLNVFVDIGQHEYLAVKGDEKLGLREIVGALTSACLFSQNL